MSVPNLIHIVEDVRASQAWDFTSKSGLCAYSHAVIVALHAEDGNFGHLVKTASQNHCVEPEGRTVAVDVSLYRATGQIVDFIASSGFGEPPPANDVIWSVGPLGEYPVSSWREPVAGDTPPPVDDPDLEHRVDLLEGQVATLQQQLADFVNWTHEVTKQIGVQNTGYAYHDGRIHACEVELGLTPPPPPVNP